MERYHCQAQFQARTDHVQAERKDKNSSEQLDPKERKLDIIRRKAADKTDADGGAGYKRSMEQEAQRF